MAFKFLNNKYVFYWLFWKKLDGLLRIYELLILEILIQKCETYT